MTFESLHSSGSPPASSHLPPMEADLILESLDSLWFFSNIFSPPPSTSCSRRDGSKKAHGDDPREPRQPTPGTQILHPESIEPPTSLVHAIEADGGADRGLDADIRRASKDPKVPNVEQRRKASNSKQSRRRKSEPRKDVKEANEFMCLGLHSNELRSEFTPVYTINGHQGRTRPYDLCGRRKPVLHCNMPPLNDGLAMKEHLKSWAYAVACTVR